MLTFAPVTWIFADTSCVLPGPYCRMPVEENWIVPELVRALGPNISVPWLTFVTPVNPFDPDRYQVALPLFLIEVTLRALLSTMAPAISPNVPAVPVSVSCLEPAPDAVKLLVNVSVPVAQRLLIEAPLVVP